MREHAQELLDFLVKQKRWPPKGEVRLLQDLQLYAAYREADVNFLIPESWPEGITYIHDPLAQRVPEVWSDMLWGEDPVIKHPDTTRVEDLVIANDLVSELQSATAMSASEGETWWRVYKDEDLSDFPIIDFHSRLTAYPYFKGRALVAVAFISVIQEENRAWRYVECHAEEVVLNRLYKVPVSQPAADDTKRANLPASTTKFGDEVPLTERKETEDIEPEWDHGLKSMLCGRVLNKRGRNFRYGVSDYQGKTQLFEALDQATNVAHSNMKLSGKKRAVIDESAMRPPEAQGTIPGVGGVPNQLMLPLPTFDTSEDIFVRSNMDESLGDNKTPPFQILEYSFEAAAMQVYDDSLTDKILTRHRVAPQLVGRHTQDAQTGPALRARLLDSVLCAHGKGSFYDGQTPEMGRALILVDNLPTSQGGFGRTYSKIDEPVSIERQDPLPADEEAELRRDVMEINAGITSRKTIIQRRHPDWDEEQIVAELDAINADSGMTRVQEPADGENQ